jgi:hypothetical protein
MRGVAARFGILIVAVSGCDFLEDVGDPTESDDSQPSRGPYPPGEAAIAIVPEDPDVGERLRVDVVTEPEDPDGDDVRYRYQWRADGELTSHAGFEVPAGATGYNELWEVTVIPTDGLNDGPPAVASVKVGNEPPEAPTMRFSSTTPGERVEVLFDEVIDPDGDNLTFHSRWTVNGIQEAALTDRLAIDAARAVANVPITVTLEISDPWHPPVVAEATVTLTYDCDNIPPFNLGDTTLRDARGYHGLAFDDDGTLLGWDGRNALTKSEYRNGFRVFIPGLHGIEQIDRMADGDFVLGDAWYNRLLRVTSAGSSTTLANNVGSVYGVTVGPDEKIYTADMGVRRADPVTGRVEQLIPESWGAQAHSLNFNLDSTQMYIGTVGDGTVYVVDLDAELNPVRPPRPYARNLGGWHDGIEVDVCGNIYVADYVTRSLYRIELDGTVTSMVDNQPNLYGHGTTWGEGIGGWRADAIYQPQPYNGSRVREVIIGLGSGDTVRTWNGVQVPW